MKKKEKEMLLQFLKSKKYSYGTFLTPTKYSWRVGYNQEIFDITKHVENQMTPQKESVVKGTVESDNKSV